jgi:hypothetical protein
MPDFLSPAALTAPVLEGHAARLGDVRPLRLSRADFEAMESPPGSGIYPGLAGRPLVLVEGGEGIGGGDGAAERWAEGVETATGALWLDGKPVWRLTLTAASLVAGGVQWTLPSPVDTLVRMECWGRAGGDGGPWIQVNGSAFAAKVDGDEVTARSPEGMSLRKVHCTLWYTRG